MKKPNLDLFPFNGCSKCPLNKNEGPCGRNTFMVEVRFKTDHFKDGFGYKLWRTTDKVKGDAIIDSGIIYCIKAYSTIIEHTYDWIWYGTRTISVKFLLPKVLKKKSLKAYAQRFQR